MNKIKLKKKLLYTSFALTGLLATTNYNKNIVRANENTPVNTNNENNRPLTIDECIKYYCDVFELKYDIIKEKIDDIINPYEWHYGSSINSVTYDNMEQAILMIVRDIYNYPEDYDLTYGEINSGIEYVPTMEAEEMIYKYSNLYNINKDIALSIAYCECGTDMESDNYLSNNNPAGIGPYYHFLNKEVGIIYFCNMLKNSYGCTNDSDSSFLYNIAGTYCEIPEHWLDLTVPIYNNVSSDFLYYVYDREKYDVDDYETPLIYKKK